MPEGDSDEVQLVIAATRVEFAGSLVPIPPPIYLRTACHAPSGKGSISVKLEGYTILVRPPRPGCIDDPDQTLSGVIEITMKERRRVQAVSVGVQCVSRLYMGDGGWEEDGLFERGVEVIGEDAYGEAVWLDRGKHLFSFTILLPNTLAATDAHMFGRLSYLLTARVEGIETAPSIFGKPKPVTPILGNVRYREDFERVIGRSNMLEKDLGRLTGTKLAGLPTELQKAASSLGLAGAGEKEPRLDGLFAQQVMKNEGGDGPKWLKGDIVISQNIDIQAVGDDILDMTRQAFDEDLGVYTVSLSSDCFGIGGAVCFKLETFNVATVHRLELYLVQQYYIFSPRHPTEPPRTDEKPYLRRLLTASQDIAETLYRLETTLRMPSHSYISPSTPDGMMTPIRVRHRFELVIAHGKGTAELGLHVMVPGCLSHTASTLPPYGSAPEPTAAELCLCDQRWDSLKASAERHRERPPETRVKS